MKRSSWCTEPMCATTLRAAARSGESARPMATVQARPPGLLAAAALHPPRREAGGGGGDEGGVEAAREQHAVGHVAHELRLDGALEGGRMRGGTAAGSAGAPWTAS